MASVMQDLKWVLGDKFGMEYDDHPALVYPPGKRFGRALRQFRLYSA
ncbi:MAG: hypothetical protein ACUVX9_02525 [Anaerolineae bacterium]